MTIAKPSSTKISSRMYFLECDELLLSGGSLPVSAFLALRVITTSLTICLRSKSANTASINIDSLGHDVRNFVIMYEQGFRKASQLVSSEALQVRELVVRQSGKNEEAIRAHVTRTATKLERKFEHQEQQASREQLRERLLKSLKYPGMNARANQVEIAHANTFHWLFEDEHNGRNRSDQDPPKTTEPIWSNFTDWLQADLGIYWIVGKPGSGKSTLMKFIWCEARTKTSLEKWRPGAVMISHYFWRPGALLQRSIKGMLCSIVYQLVLYLPDALDYASATVAGLEQKDADTDWSVPELHQLCLDLIKHCGRPLCLFIDGLDECGPEDNQQRLLETLDKIRFPNVKIIVSSRSEPAFERRFKNEPQLRVQDLTVRDLQTYAADMLLRDVKVYIREELVERAEGVFLWLALAVQSINRGLSSGDSFEELHKRVRKLPRGLNDLYRDMWERLNDDSDLYRESAALYFKIAIAGDDRELQCLRRGWTRLDMMLASSAEDHDTFAKRPVISASQLLKECDEFHKRVGVRCAGLLGLYGEPDLRPRKLELGDTEIALLDYASGRTRFRFIHRSARDFLVNTVEGQNILRHDGTSSEDINIRLISARLRALELLDSILRDAAKSWYCHDDCVCISLEAYFQDLTSIADARDSAARELFSRCFELYRSSSLLLSYDDARPARIAAFFGEAPRYPNLRQHFTSIIENQLVGSSIRSAILSYVAETYTGQRGQRALKLARWLLSLPDVDVNLKCPLILPSSGRKWYSPNDIGPLDHITESPFNRFLGFVLKDFNWRRAGRRWYPYQFLGLISDFAFHGADFRSTLFVAIPLSFGGQGWVPLDRHVEEVGFHQFATHDLAQWVHLYEHRDHTLCVLALQASTVIRRMLARLPMTTTGNFIINEDEYRTSEDAYSVSDLETAIPLLSQKCQEQGGGASDRVIGFIPSPGKSSDMPYRQVSDQDSAQLLEVMWECMFDDGLPAMNLYTACKEVLAKSPLSSIGFGDYLRDLGCFNEVDADKLLLEYQAGMLTPPPTCAFEV